jgi:murein DD-endopeptidase MepM/ murein hydrolase activator NlpD
MIFPEFKYKKSGYVNLNLEAGKWLAENNIPETELPFHDPVKTQAMVESIHKKYNIDFSYGGWMEDRSVLWKGYYLEEAGTSIHLGIDINVPSGTEIAASFDATVVRIDDDYPEIGGWGPRIILRHHSEPIYMIYAHLDRTITCTVGDEIKKGDIFAKVGEAPYNGNWFPHLHLQVISKEYFDHLEKENAWADLDGYGAESDIKENSKHFPDPMQYISLN